jgi:hypothetical protein
MGQRLNRAVIVEKKPGASGNIGTQAAARANPDGQNLLVTVNTFVMNASLYSSIPYDPEKSRADCGDRDRSTPRREPFDQSQCSELIAPLAVNRGA